MTIMNGKEVSSKLLQDIKEEVKKLEFSPTLAVLQIGDDAASDVYVAQKRKIADSLGFNFIHEKFNETDNEDVIINKISELNENINVNGIIVQLPIPNKFNTDKILNTILPSKDVDGLTNTSKVNLINNNVSFIPCTPLGIIKLLEFYNIDTRGKNIVIVGRSNLVGKPLFNLLINMDATVTLCHSKTKNLSFHTKNADILVSATGIKHLIKGYMVKDGSVVIDVGITREDGKLYGDVDFDSVNKKTSYITPVPGGVGPMTVVMLMSNTIDSYKKSLSFKKI